MSQPLLTKETVKRMPSAKANEPNRPVKQELFLRSKVATWRLFARLLSNLLTAAPGVDYFDSGAVGGRLEHFGRVGTRNERQPRLWGQRQYCRPLHGRTPRK